MPPFIRNIRPIEPPGRLHLAILEWQRQLLEMNGYEEEQRVLDPHRREEQFRDLPIAQPDQLP